MTGNTLPRLQTEDIKNLIVPIPEPELQASICKHISEIRRQANQLKVDANSIMINVKYEVEEMIIGRKYEEFKRNA